MHRRRFHLRFAKRNHITRFLDPVRLKASIGLFRSYIYVRAFLEKGTKKTDMVANQVSMYGICFVWSKTTLIPGGVGGTEAGPHTCKMETFL